MDGNVGTLMGETGGGGGGGGGGGVGNAEPVPENDYSEYSESHHQDDQQHQHQQNQHQQNQHQQNQHQQQQQQLHQDNHDPHDQMDEANNDDPDNQNSLNNLSNNSNDMQNVATKRHASDMDYSGPNKYQKRQKTGYNNYNSGGGGGGGGPFQNRAGKIDLRILLPSKDAGAIIGRGGSNIKKLRLEHKTIIQVPDCDGPERLLLIGGDTDAAISTILDIIPLLEENQYNTGPSDGNTELRLLVHQSQAGCVIGRNGDKIKDLRVKHNLDMKVYSECAPQSTERICQMKGKPHDIVQCLREVLSLLDTAPPKGMIRPYDPHNHNEFLSSQYGGYIGDKRPPGGSGRMNPGGGSNNGGNFSQDRGGNSGGPNRGFNTSPYEGGSMNDNRGRSNMRGGGNSRGNDRESQEDGGGYRSSSNSRGGGGGGGFGRGGPDNRRGGGSSGGPRGGGDVGGGRGGRNFSNDNKSFNNNNNNNNQSYGRPSSNNGNGGGSSANGSGYGNNNSGGGSMSYSNQANNNSSNNAGISTNQVTIPNDLAGAIIGPKGQKIQQIREQSGAGITIDKPLPGSTDRIITIQGTPEQIQNAQYLLQLTVKQSGLWQGQ